MPPQRRSAFGTLRGFRRREGEGAPGSPCCGRDASSSSSQDEGEGVETRTNQPAHPPCHLSILGNSNNGRGDIETLFPVRYLDVQSSRRSRGRKGKGKKGERWRTHSRTSFGEGCGLRLVPARPARPAYRSACASNEKNNTTFFTPQSLAHARVRQLQLREPG